MRRSLFLCSLLLSAVLITGWSAAPAQSRKYIGEVRTSQKDALPFSEAVLVGDTLYIGGQLGLGADGRAPSDVDEEIRLVLDSMESALKQAGMEWDDLVSVQVFCTDLKLYDRFNRQYRARFKTRFPARMFVGSGPLLRGAHFELNGIADRRK